AMKPPKRGADFEVQFLVETEVAQVQSRASQALGPKLARVRFTEPPHLDEQIGQTPTLEVLTAERLKKGFLVQTCGLLEARCKGSQTRRSQHQARIDAVTSTGNIRRPRQDRLHPHAQFLIQFCDQITAGRFTKSHHELILSLLDGKRLQFKRLLLRKTLPWSRRNFGGINEAHRQ